MDISWWSIVYSALDSAILFYTDIALGSHPYSTFCSNSTVFYTPPVFASLVPSPTREWHTCNHIYTHLLSIDYFCWDSLFLSLTLCLSLRLCLSPSLFLCKCVCKCAWHAYSFLSFSSSSPTPLFLPWHSLSPPSCSNMRVHSPNFRSLYIVALA